MEIALIKQKTRHNLENNRNSYQNKIKHILEETNADIVVGPEFAISNSISLIDYSQLKIFNEKILDLIKDTQLIMPGTGLVFNPKNKTLRNVAPILMKNRIYLFNKKSSVIEKEIANSHGLEYETDPDNVGIFPYRDKFVAIEICRDQGHGKLKYSTNNQVDLEFIIACNLGGFSLDKAVVKEGGIVAVVDGYAPEAYAYKKRKNELGFTFEPINGRETEDYLLIKNE